MYIERTLQKIVQDTDKSFPVILLTGPRQVGKTTLLQNITHNRSYISLDDIDTRAVAQEDPAGFLERLKLPTLIDEVQYAPQLFPYIKMIVDRVKKPGLFWLTGSQQFSMMKNISESLAGRVAILELQGISLSEELKRPNTTAFLPTVALLEQRQNMVQELSIQEMYHKIWRGSYPHVVLDGGKTWQRFYESYITTYIERDVREYLQIDNLVLFRKFLQLAAARTGQLLNYREISKELGISEPTVKSWFNVLQATGLVRLIQPYYRNISKRLIKTPKFHFLDTGLCCFLTGWVNADVLERGAMSGAMLESYVVSEVLKSYIHNGVTPQLYYYRDKEQNEIDLLLEQSDKLYPIEIKKASSLFSKNFKGFDFLEKNLKTLIEHGCILCFCKNILPLGSKIDVVPIWYL
jgi:uncharacterized protein